MSFNFDHLKPKQSNWFSPNIKYEGTALAEFQNPPGVIEGKITITFDEFGKTSIEMEVDKSYDVRSVLNLLSGKSDGTAFRIVVPSSSNICSNLSIEIISPEEGNFLIHGELFYTFTPLPLLTGENVKINFHINGHHVYSQFDVKMPSKPKYWILPLINFISEFRVSHQSRNEHPLRICPTTKYTLPTDASEPEKFLALQAAFSKNHLIIFEYNKEPGFIEPLFDYEEREKSLLGCKEKHLITAVMIGEIGGDSIDFTEVRNGIIFDLLPLLGLITGSSVGSQWIEFRDENAALIRRTHVNLGNPRYFKGHGAVPPHKAGELITTFLKAKFSEDERKYLRNAMRQFARSAIYEKDTIDSLGHICRGLESMYEGFAEGKQPDSLARLDPNLRASVVKICEEAVAEIKKLRLDPSVSASDKKALEQTVEQRIRSSITNKDRKFGLQVIALLEEYQLKDADVMEQHYKNNPTKYNNQTWADYLSLFRNDFAHRDYFSNLAENWDQAAPITYHLHDILSRVILKCLGYTGQYQSTIMGEHSSESLDWIESGFTANQLRYR